MAKLSEKGKKMGLHEFTTTHITEQEIHYKKMTTKTTKKTMKKEK